MGKKQDAPVELTASSDDAGRRLDRILRKALPNMPLSRIHRVLRKGMVLVDGKVAGPDARLAAGSVITTPDFRPEPARTPVNNAPSSGLCVLWEGEGLLFLNKPAGLRSHGPDSLEIAARAYLANRIPPSLSFRPGPLHRLDTPTSGVITFSASLEGARIFSALTREGRIKKRYLALLDGVLKEEAVCAEPLERDLRARKTRVAPEGRTAETRLIPLASAGGYSLARAEISAGKTHQIRAHAAFHGNPLSGDRKYGGSFQKGGLLLHACALELPLPDKEGAFRRISAPLPPRFRARIAALFGGAAARSLSSPESGETLHWRCEAVPPFE